jgi:hypothetical protein
MEFVSWVCLHCDVARECALSESTLYEQCRGESFPLHGEVDRGYERSDAVVERLRQLGRADMDHHS